MQSSLLDLLANVNTLKNIAENNSKKLNEIGINRVVDLLFYFPTNIIVRNFCKNANDLKIKQHCVIKVKVLSIQKKLRRTLVSCRDIDDNIIHITFFKLFKGYLEKYLPVDKEILILGIPEIYNNIFSFNHPQILSPSLINNLNPIECIYRQYKGITSVKFSNYINQALRIINNCEIPEWLDKKYLEDNKFPSFITAINNIHNPKTVSDIQVSENNITRLAIDEMVAYHLNLMNTRHNKEVKKSLEYNITGKLTTILKKNIPFELTSDQQQAITNIKKEFLTPYPSTILLQGDVGSGKTIVCFIAALFAVESGYQVACMCPTEILASQHYNNFLSYSKFLGIKVALLKGKEKTSTKREILYGLLSKDIDIVVGTHSLFQEAVSFKNLGLVIIDEQQRFGVDQRLKLLNKGNNPNLLLTTATPIPRTLILSLYGDIKYFDIKEKPKDRKPILTTLLSKSRLGDLMDGLKRALSRDEKVFWICPLIEESDKLELASSLKRYDYLSKELIVSNKQLFLVHGRMSLEEKDKIIAEFKAISKGAILVATTVIEVGIDIPECNIIIIEDAHNFGLAQLHQLRGRVGRGFDKGICILLYPEEISLSSKKRLSILKESDDGFYIAKKDMELRGYGDILGVNQSGSQDFKIINLDEHSCYMSLSLQYAKFIFNKINNNEEIYIKNINFLLRIFDRFNNKEYLKSG